MRPKKAFTLIAALKQKDYENAIRYGEKTIALKPGRFMHFFLGVAYFHSQKNEAAATQFELALEAIQKGQAASPSERAQVHKRLGLVRTRQKKYDLAIIQFNESLKLNPKQPDMFNTLAWTLVTCPDEVLRDPSKALKLAQQACRLTQSKHPVYLNTLAVAYVSLNNFSEAARISEKAVALAQAKGDHALAAKLQKQLDLIKKALAESK